MNALASPVCPVCRKPDAAPRFAVAASHYFECRDCGSGFVHPVWSNDEASEAHQGVLYRGKDEKKLKRGARRIKYLMRFRRGGRFLDLGCNGGFMVEIARRNGFAAVGIDVDPVSIDYARGRFPDCSFVLDRVEAWEPTAPRFDLIYCSEVIEHLPDPHPVMETVARLLAPGGHVFFTTPDLGHWRRPRDLRRWNAFCPPAHCTYFTAAALERLAARYGLEKAHRRLNLKPGIQMMFRKSAAAGG